MLKLFKFKGYANKKAFTKDGKKYLRELQKSEKGLEYEMELFNHNPDYYSHDLFVEEICSGHSIIGVSLMVTFFVLIETSILLRQFGPYLIEDGLEINKLVTYGAILVPEALLITKCALKIIKNEIWCAAVEKGATMEELREGTFWKRFKKAKRKEKELVETKENELVKTNEKDKDESMKITYEDIEAIKKENVETKEEDKKEEKSKMDVIHVDLDYLLKEKEKLETKTEEKDLTKGLKK